MRACLVSLVACAACSTTGSSSLFPSDTTQFVMTSQGGLAPQAGSGSTCQPENSTFTYVLATRALSWTECASPNDDGVYSFVPGQATLSADDGAQLVAQLQALGPAPETCGGDFQATFVFTTSHGEQDTYSDAMCLAGASDVMDAVYGDAQ
jgi:hypothetical protein